MSNHKKIINDPLHGFVTLSGDLIFELLEHSCFQRLRRIKQMGLADMVYPGAVHTRFHHALGAMFLMNQALDTLQQKGLLIMDIEKEAALVAILLHDIGHGPFSHVLEYTLLDRVSHEDISRLLMYKLNQEFGGALALAIQMFEGTYHRTFFNQLISSQLDVDRLDYLNRDSFYSGVVEGMIGAERIIKMLNVVDNELVVEQKGLLSVENFLNARRLMYWQVYLHKTSVSAEQMVLKIFERAKELISAGIPPVMDEDLFYFLEKKISLAKLEQDGESLECFTRLDDADIYSALKSWSREKDNILSSLCQRLLNRKLYKVVIGAENDLEQIEKELRERLTEIGTPESQHKYYFQRGELLNYAYAPKHGNIYILMKSGIIQDIAEASDLPNIKALRNIVKKNFICYDKALSLPILNM